MKLTEAQRAHQDKVQDAALERYPNGLTIPEFKRVTLESADEDGRLYPLSLPALMEHSVLMGMWLTDKTVEPGWTVYNAPMWWRITPASRAVLGAEGDQ
jgi:hypothetical protein